MADRVNEAAIDSSFTAAQDGPAITKEVSVIAARGRFLVLLLQEWDNKSLIADKNGLFKEYNGLKWPQFGQ